MISLYNDDCMKILPTIVAHETEDDLYRIVLEEVAAGNPEGREMARAALATKTIDFPRWYA